MKEDHTPGPWRATHVREGDPIAYVWAGDGILVGVTYRPYMATTSASQNANADLIATAPEMLALLKEFAGDVMGAGDDDRQKRVKALVAKAEGRKEQDQ